MRAQVPKVTIKSRSNGLEKVLITIKELKLDDKPSRGEHSALIYKRLLEKSAK